MINSANTPPPINAYTRFFVVLNGDDGDGEFTGDGEDGDGEGGEGDGGEGDDGEGDPSETLPHWF